jgi:hypothetical protein
MGDNGGCGNHNSGRKKNNCDFVKVIYMLLTRDAKHDHGKLQTTHWLLGFRLSMNETVLNNLRKRGASVSGEWERLVMSTSLCGRESKLYSIGLKLQLFLYIYV